MLRPGSGSCVPQLEQYTRYVNRYGSGAVVYWAGFVHEAASGPAAAAQGVALLSAAPAVSATACLPRLPLP